MGPRLSNTYDDWPAKKKKFKQIYSYFMLHRRHSVEIFPTKKKRLFAKKITFFQAESSHKVQS
jgi:hypothetical protein